MTGNVSPEKEIVYENSEEIRSRFAPFSFRFGRVAIFSPCDFYEIGITKKRPLFRNPTNVDKLPSPPFFETPRMMEMFPPVQVFPFTFWKRRATEVWRRWSSKAENSRIDIRFVDFVRGWYQKAANWLTISRFASRRPSNTSSGTPIRRFPIRSDIWTNMADRQRWNRARLFVQRRSVSGQDTQRSGPLQQ